MFERGIPANRRGCELLRESRDSLEPKYGGRHGQEKIELLATASY